MSHEPHNTPSPSMNNLTLIRRANLHALLADFTQTRAAAGATTGAKGDFAQALQIHPSLLSHLLSARPVSDKLARQIEVACGRPSGWMDRAHSLEAGPTKAESAFLELARDAWRSGNARQKRSMRTCLLEELEAARRRQS